jgi:hypothetical protein
MNGRNRRHRPQNQGGRPENRQPRPQQPAVPARDVENARPAPACPICEKPVSDLVSAIAHRETGAPVHFECVLRWLGDAEKILPDERLVYLGNGAFGVTAANLGGNQRIAIKRMIQYEQKDKKPEWRKEISARYAGR